MTAVPGPPETLCPICEQPACSLLHIRDRLLVPVYNTVIVPLVNGGARVLSRVCLLLAAIDIIGMLAGWWTP